ncbi:MAG: hypothetical protein DRN55_06050 [Thermoplasmata archaeon]|nr:MAG: hypothetical protein DRN55_06050 [Thermoplasmata archaeon]
MVKRLAYVLMLLIAGSAFFQITSADAGNEDVPLAPPGVRASVINNTYSYNISLSIGSGWNTSKLSYAVFFQSVKQTSKAYENDASRRFQSALVYNSLWVPLDGNLTSSASRRVVLVEDFTGTWCGYCPGVEGALDRIINDKRYFPDNTTIIEWHYGDSYAYSGSNARVSFYGVSAYPTLIVDGVLGRVGGSTNANNTQIDNAIKSMINTRLSVSPIARIDAFAGKTSSNAWVNVTLTMLANPDYYQAKVYFVLLEDLYPEKHGGAYMRYTARADTSRTITFPNDPPQVQLLSPQPGTYAGDLTIRWQALDNESARESLKVKLEYQRESSSWNLIGNSLPNSGSFVWHTKSVPDGRYRIRITVNDPWNGVSALTSDWFNILNPDPPMVSLLTPNGGEILSGTYTIRWSASDDEDQKTDLNVSLYYKRGTYGEWTPIVENISNTDEYYEWDTTSPRVPDGDNYWLRVAVFDTDGMMGEAISAASFSIQNPDPPTIRIIYPVGGETLSGVVNILWSASDDENRPAELRISMSISSDGGGNWTAVFSDSQNTGSYSLDTTKYEDGNSYRVKITVRDLDGMTATAISENFSILNNDPPLVRFTSPSTGQTVSGTVTIKWSATDEEDSSDVLKVTLYYIHMGKKTYLLEDEPNPGEYVWDTTEAEDGDYSFTIVVKDSFLEESEPATLMLTVYNPDPPLLNDFHLSTETAQSILTIYWSAEDPDYDSLNIELSWRASGESLWNQITVATEDVGNFEWDVSSLPEGSYEVRIVVRDAANLTVEDTATFTIERPDAPVIRLINPTPGEYDKEVLISWEASDPDGDSLTYTIQYSTDGAIWNLIITDYTGTTYTWNISTLPNGRYWVKVIARDSSPDHMTAEVVSEEITVRHTSVQPPGDNEQQPDTTVPEHTEKKSNTALYAGIGVVLVVIIVVLLLFIMKKGGKRTEEQPPLPPGLQKPLPPGVTSPPTQSGPIETPTPPQPDYGYNPQPPAPPTS